jgi:hypothetical protein
MNSGAFDSNDIATKTANILFALPMLISFRIFLSSRIKFLKVKTVHSSESDARRALRRPVFALRLLGILFSEGINRKR